MCQAEGQRLVQPRPRPSEGLVGSTYVDMYVEQEARDKYLLDQSGYSCVHLQHLVCQHRGSGQCVFE